MRITTTLAFIASTLFVTAQQNVVLEIEHLVGTVPVTITTVATNNNGEQFAVSRLQYYISEIVLIHDGGQATPVPATWILANALTGTSQPLGSFNIIALEAIEFGIGVNAAVNHLDPAQYDANHPLAPKSPSMHWGWSPGYRFIALEGGSGSGQSQNYEIHALGDVNYHKQTIPTTGITSGNALTVLLKADYEEALSNISVSSGPIVHGETGIARDLIANFQFNVFTSVEGNGPVGLSEDQRSVLLIFPNPTSGIARISLVDMVGSGEIRIHDAIGKLVSSIPVVGGRLMDIEVPAAGVYRISLLQGNGQLLSSQTLVKH